MNTQTAESSRVTLPRLILVFCFSSRRSNSKLYMFVNQSLVQYDSCILLQCHHPGK